MATTDKNKKVIVERLNLETCPSQRGVSSEEPKMTISFDGKVGLNNYALKILPIDENNVEFVHAEDGMYVVFSKPSKNNFKFKKHGISNTMIADKIRKFFKAEAKNSIRVDIDPDPYIPMTGEKWYLLFNAKQIVRKSPKK